MAQLTNTRIYGTLDVDNVITAKNGINVTPLKNSTNTVDNSAKITLNSMIVDDKQDSTKKENKLSSIKLSSKNKRYGKIEHASMADYLVQSNSLFSYTAEIKNNAGALLSLNLRRVNSEEHKTFNDSGSVIRLRSYDIDRYDTLYNISVNVSDFYKASDSKPEVIYDNVNSTYETENTDPTGIFSGNTNTTKSTVNLQLTVPYEGGRIITDETCDRRFIARQFYVTISTTEQLTKLLSSNVFKNCITGLLGVASPGVVLYAVISHNNTGTSYPVLFYTEGDRVYMSKFSPSGGRFDLKNELNSTECLYIIVSTKAAYDALRKAIA